MTLAILGTAFAQGLISSLSACVYPLIPITTALFGAGRVGHWLQGFFLSSIYVLGMALTYVALGLAAALGGSVFGAYLGDPIVIVVFAVLFILLGLGFLGVIPMPLPNFGDKMHVEKKNMITYPLILGIFSGFIAAPCTAPFFGAVLVDIAANSATNESVIPGITQAFAFSLGMGLPFLLIGTFAVKLPKPGKWLQVVKFIGATILFTFAFHYVEDIMGPFPNADNLLLYAILGVLLFAVFLMLAEPLNAGAMETKRGKLYVSVFLLIAAFGLFLATSPLRGNTKPVNPVEIVSTDIHVEGEVVWYDSMEEGMKVAQKTGAVILVDFWAEWCTQCYVMEAELFTSPEFRSIVLTKGIVLIRLDVTKADSEKEELLQKYNAVGLPTLALTDSDGNLIDSALGFRNKEHSLDWMRNITAGIKNIIP
ncbi:MAG: cytochrome c biogenesis protein CcdA [Leptospirales bacterium]